MAGRLKDLVRFSDAEAERLARFYAEAEREILDQLNRALLRGNKTEYLARMRDNVRTILQDLRAGSRTWCEQAIPRVYVKGAATADMMIAARGRAVVGGFGAIHQQAAQVLAENTFGRFDSVAQLIGRRSEDIYRTLALENIRGSVVGYATWQGVARNLREDLARRGVTGFRDAKNRDWNMRSYAEMVARTSTMEAHLQGTANRLLEHGHDLVRVSTHARACEKCRPWQGKGLSLTGKTEGYPTMEEAREAGLFHPRCRHAYGLHIDLDADIRALEAEEGVQSVAGVGGVPEGPRANIPVAGLTNAAKRGIMAAMEQALAHGLDTKTECLLTVDANTGAMVYNKIGGAADRVPFTPELTAALEQAQPRSMLLVHNHPGSSAFSRDDVALMARLGSIRGLFVIGHDGNKYYVGDVGGTAKGLSTGQIVAEYEKYKTLYHGHYRDLVLSGKMTPEAAWKEHSHRIMEDLSRTLNLEYIRWDQP